MGLLDTIMGRTPVPTAQEQAGGIPQNADPGKRPLGGGLLGIRGGKQGKGGGGGAPKVTPMEGGQGLAPSPAQLMPQQAPMAATAAPPPTMRAMTGAAMTPQEMQGMMRAQTGAAITPQEMQGMGGNPMMMQQALMQRLAQRGGY